MATHPVPIIAGHLRNRARAAGLELPMGQALLIAESAVETALEDAVGKHRDPDPDPNWPNREDLVAIHGDTYPPRHGGPVDTSRSTL